MILKNTDGVYKMNFNNYIKMALFMTLIVTIYPVDSIAQDWVSSITYQISIPAGDTKQFTDDISFRGFAMDFRKQVDKSATVGLLLGWNVFYQRVTQTTELETENPVAITGVQDRTLNAFPLMLNAHYYFGSDNKFYAGLNAGGYYMLQRFDIGIYRFQNDEWQWGIIPEIGFMTPLSGGSTLIINAKYNYTFTGESPLGGDINHQYWSIGIGWAWSQY